MKAAIVLFCSALAIASNAVAESGEPLASRNNRFAFELYSRITSDEGNIFLSPYSISSAMAMVYEGARAGTAAEIQSVFYFDTPPELGRKSWAESLRLMNTGDGTNILTTANALWAQKGFHFSTEYLDTVSKFYGGAAANLDFAADTERSRETINHWVEEHTQQKIKDLLSPGTVVSDTRLVLTNAVYFKGQWANEFDADLTLDANFTTSTGAMVKSRMMRMSGMDATFGYTETEGVQAVELPYKGGAISMVLLLPTDKNLSAFEKRLMPEVFSKVLRSLSAQEIVLQFPRFKVEAKYFMQKVLIAMGLKLSFDVQKADFSGMTGERNIYISEVIHQSFVEVTEQGTEAAASTAVAMLAGSAYREPKPIPVFRADRPFLFFILDKRTGAIIFMGRVADPKQ